MAFFDDKRMLLAHIRHSFVISDDTGMCELTIVKEDVDQEIQNDHSFHKRSVRMRQRYQTGKGGRNLEKLGTSYDIRASPSLPRRPPLKNDSNMFEVMEERKKKKSGGKSIVVKWQDPSPENCNMNFFKPEPFKKTPRPPQPSLLSKLLAEQQKKTSNPFYSYQKFNGESQGPSLANNYTIFLSMAKNPFKPVKISVLHNARVEDLIGLAFWKYLDEEREKIMFKPVTYYSVMIAEEDGEIDVDLPELDRNEYIGKYGFKHLGIVQCASPVKPANDDENEDSKKHKIVKVYYEDGGFSTIAVDSLDVEMSEVLTLVMRKRRLQFQGYELEIKDHPGQYVDLSSTLRNQGTMDFKLKHIPRYSQTDDDIDGKRTKERSFTQVKVQLTSHQYKAFNVLMLHKMRSNTRVQLGIDYEHIEIQSTEPQSTGRFRKPHIKPAQYEIQEIRSCSIINEERSSGGCVFRIVRIGKDGLKNMDFEAPNNVAKEIVQKISLILNDATSVHHEEIDPANIKRKTSRTNINPNH